MGRAATIFVWIGAVLLILGAGGFALLAVRFDSIVSSLRPTIEEAISKVAGRPVAIGAINGTIDSSARIVVRDVKIKQQLGGDDAQWPSVDEVTATVALAPIFLRREIAVSKVIVNNLRAQLRVKQGGGFEVVGLAAKSEKNLDGAPEKISEPVETKPKTAAKGNFLSGFSADEVAIKNSSVSIVDPENNLRAQLNNGSLTGTIAFDANGGGKIARNLKLTGDLKLPMVHPEGSPVTVEVAELLLGPATKEIAVKNARMSWRETEGRAELNYNTDNFILIASGKNFPLAAIDAFSPKLDLIALKGMIASAAVSLDGESRSPVETTIGDVNLALKDIVLPNVNVLVGVFDALRDLPVVGDKIQAQITPDIARMLGATDTTVHTGDIQAQITNGSMTINSFGAQTAPLSITGKGKVNIATGVVDLKTQIYLEKILAEPLVNKVDELKFLLASDAQETRLLIPTRIKGSYKELKVIPEIKDIALKVAREKIEEKIEEKVQEKANKLLKKWLN